MLTARIVSVPPSGGSTERPRRPERIPAPVGAGLVAVVPVSDHPKPNGGAL